MNAGVGEFSADTGRSGSSAGFSIVVAMDRNRGIGNKGDLPWPKLKGDMRFFRELTTCPDREAVEKRWGLKPEESAETKSWDEVSAMLKFAHPLPSTSLENQNIVVMGRKTWESLPDQFRPLSDRYNLVFTRNLDYYTRDIFKHGGARCVAGSVSGALTYSFNDDQRLADESLILRYVIGGGQVFSDALHQEFMPCDHLYITEIDAAFECDTYFPEAPDFRPVLSSPWIEENGIRYRFRRYDRV